MADIVGPAIVQVNTTNGYTVVPSTYISYNWVVDPSGIILTGQGTPVVTVQWTVLGEFTLTCELNGGQGTVDSIYIVVDVNTQGGKPK